MEIDNEIFSERKDQYENMNKVNYAPQRERQKNILKIRRNNINNQLFSKRLESDDLAPKQIDLSEYAINIENLNCPDYLKKNYTKYLKTEFNLSKWKSTIFSKNPQEAYLGLFMLRNYINMQIDEIKPEDRLLTKNDNDFIEFLCKNLLINDKRIQYETLWCLSNITLFKKSEKYVYMDKNLKIIFNFFITFDDMKFFVLISILIINILTNNSNRITFINNKDCVNKLIAITKWNIMNPREMRAVLKLIENLSNILVCHNNNNNESNINSNEYNLYMNILLGFLPFMKTNFNDFFIGNSFSGELDGYYFFIYFSNILRNGKYAFEELFEDNFCKSIVISYGKIHDIDIKKFYIRFISNIISCSKAMTYDTFLKDGILNIFIDLFNIFSKVPNLDLYLIDDILFNISILAECSEVNHFLSNSLLLKIIDFCGYLIESKEQNDNISIVFSGALALISVINKSNNAVRQTLLDYNKGILIKIFYFTLLPVNYNLVTNKDFYSHLIESFYNLILMAEENYDKETQNNFRKLLQELNIEENIQWIVSNCKNIHEYYDKLIKEISNFIKENML